MKYFYREKEREKKSGSSVINYQTAVINYNNFGYKLSRSVERNSGYLRTCNK